MRQAHFDAEAFYRALDKARENNKISWKKVADQAGVSASTLTRLAQGKRPDVDSLAALTAWAGVKADNFMCGPRTEPTSTSPVEEIAALFRADPNLDPGDAQAMETILRTAYERFRKE